MNFKIIILTLLTVILSLSVLAVPNLDNHQFYGTVSWDEGSAVIDSVKLVITGNEIVTPVTELACDKVCTGKYGYEGNILRVQGTAGATVQFFLGENQVTTYPYQTGGITELDLDISTVELPKENCDENWDCASWSSCTDGKQKRSCTDLNECDPNYLTSEQEQVCDVTACSMEWLCTEWSSCLTGKKTRTCSRSDSCGVDALSVSKPVESKSCVGVNSLVPPPGKIGTSKEVSESYLSDEKVGSTTEQLKKTEKVESVNGEEGMSMTLIFGVILILLALVAVWFLFLRKKDIQ